MPSSSLKLLNLKAMWAPGNYPCATHSAISIQSFHATSISSQVFINLIIFAHQEERLLRMGDELSRLASYEAECHRKDGVIAALRDEVVDLKGALQPSGGFRYGYCL